MHIIDRIITYGVFIDVEEKRSRYERICLPTIRVHRSTGGIGDGEGEWGAAHQGKLLAHFLFAPFLRALQLLLER